MNERQRKALEQISELWGPELAEPLQELLGSSSSSELPAVRAEHEAEEMDRQHTELLNAIQDGRREDVEELGRSLKAQQQWPKPWENVS